MYEGRESMTLTKLRIEENNLEEAGFMSKSFVQEEIKNRAYINIVGAELLKKYLETECDIKTEDLFNIHSVTRILEHMDISDIILPNIHIDSRVIFDDEQIFIPKSHFENGYEPDVYFILKLSENFEEADFIGFIEPKNIDKNKANKDYYFVDKSELESVESFNSFVCSFSSDKGRELSEEEILKGRELSISLADHNISDNDFRELISLLVVSRALRESVIEYDNFETLSYSVVSEISIEKEQESDLQDPKESETASFQDYNYDDSGMELKPEIASEGEITLNEDNSDENISAGGELAADAAEAAAMGEILSGGIVSQEAINLANAAEDIIDNIVNDKVKEQYQNIDKADYTKSDVYKNMPDEEDLLGLSMDKLDMPEEIKEEQDFSVNVDDLETIDSNQYTPIENDDSVVGLSDLPAAEMKEIEEFDNVTDFENISAEDGKYTPQDDLNDEIFYTNDSISDMQEIKNETAENFDTGAEDLKFDDLSSDNLISTDLENFEIDDFSNIDLSEDLSGDVVESTIQESQDPSEDALFEDLLSDDQIMETDSTEEISDSLSETSQTEELISDSEIEFFDNIDTEDEKEISDFQNEELQNNVSEDNINLDFEDENLPGYVEDNTEQNFEKSEENNQNDDISQDLNFSDMEISENEAVQDTENNITSDLDELADESFDQEENTISDVDIPEDIDRSEINNDSDEVDINNSDNPEESTNIDEINQVNEEAELEEIEPELTAYYNSNIISSKTPIVGEIAVDVNILEKSYDEHEHLEDIYNESADFKEGSILSNPTRFIREKYGKNSPMMLAITGGVLVLAIVGIIGMSAMKMLKPAEEQVAGIDNSVPPVPEVPKTSNPAPLNVDTERVVSMDDKAVVQEKRGTPAPAVKAPKLLPENVYLDTSKISWEIPDYISYDPNFKKYFQSSGKSIKSALSSDLLLATEYPYSDQVRLSILYDKSGMFKDAKILLSSGSQQVDKIVLQSVNHILKALKAPASIGNDESTTVILKIYF